VKVVVVDDERGREGEGRFGWTGKGWGEIHAAAAAGFGSEFREARKRVSATCLIVRYGRSSGFHTKTGKAVLTRGSGVDTCGYLEVLCLPAMRCGALMYHPGIPQYLFTLPTSGSTQGRV